MGRPEQEYKEALDSLRFSADGKERIMKNLMEQREAGPEKRRGVRPLRAALIAAAACLALAGTALAAQYLGVQIVSGNGGESDADLWLRGGIAYYSLDSLSDEVRALEGEHTYEKFDSWQELEKFVGAKLMDNPVLDASPATAFHIRISGPGHDVSGKFLVLTSVSVDQLLLYGCYEIGDVDISVKGFLYTENAKGRDWDERFVGYSFAEGTQVSQESYTAPSGLEAQILTVDHAGGRTDKYRAVLTLNGVPYVIDARVGQNPSAAREALLQVLDGFVV